MGLRGDCALSPAAGTVGERSWRERGDFWLLAWVFSGREGLKGPAWMAGAGRSAHLLHPRGARSGRLLPSPPGDAERTRAPSSRPGDASGSPSAAAGLRCQRSPRPERRELPAFPLPSKNPKPCVSVSLPVCSCADIGTSVCAHPRAARACVRLRVSLPMGRGLSQLCFMVVNGLPGEVPDA